MAQQLWIDSDRFEFAVSVHDSGDITVWLIDTAGDEHRHYPFDGVTGAVHAATRIDSGDYETDEESWKIAEANDEEYCWSEEW